MYLPPASSTTAVVDGCGVNDESAIEDVTCMARIATAAPMTARAFLGFNRLANTIATRAQPPSASVDGSGTGTTPRVTCSAFTELNVGSATPLSRTLVMGLFSWPAMPKNVPAVSPTAKLPWNTCDAPLKAVSVIVPEVRVPPLPPSLIEKNPPKAEITEEGACRVKTSELPALMLLGVIALNGLLTSETLTCTLPEVTAATLYAKEFPEKS